MSCSLPRRHARKGPHLQLLQADRNGSRPCKCTDRHGGGRKGHHHGRQGRSDLPIRSTARRWPPAGFIPVPLRQRQARPFALWPPLILNGSASAETSVQVRGIRLKEPTVRALNGKVMISNPNPNSELRYTLDGSAPTERSAVYPSSGLEFLPEFALSRVCKGGMWPDVHASI